MTDFTPTDFKFYGEDFFTATDSSFFLSAVQHEQQFKKRTQLSVNTTPCIIGTPARLVGTSNEAAIDLDSAFQHLVDEEMNFQVFSPSTFLGEQQFLRSGGATPTFQDLEALLDPNFNTIPSTMHQDNTSSSGSDNTSQDSEEQEPRKKIVAKKKSKDESIKKKEKAEVPTDTSRIWSTSFKDEGTVGNGDIQILIKTRRDKPSEYLPDKMYSSLKYELIQTAKGDFLKNIPFLLCRATVIDSTTLEEIKKQKPVLKGNVEVALTKPTTSKKDDEFECRMKTQFDFSYHQDKRLISMELKYYLPDQLEQPILIKRSCPLRVYARKPNKPKRKKDQDKEEKLKKQKIEQQTSFNEFMQKLEHCFSLANSFAEEEKKKAMDIIMLKCSQNLGTDLLNQQQSALTNDSFIGDHNHGDIFRELL
ncbi:hypothetical protein ABK040_009812 [Willaertia magna]